MLTWHAESMENLVYAATTITNKWGNAVHNSAQSSADSEEDAQSGWRKLPSSIFPHTTHGCQNIIHNQIYHGADIPEIDTFQLKGDNSRA